MIRPRLAAAALAAFITVPAAGADLRERPEPGRFLASCEDLGRFCLAEACGRDQIAAALACRARCPSSAVLAVVPAACPLAAPASRLVLRRHG
ncbi:hypothetical protein [uncultured Methylobacterium sp.]|uniref:hypothetical protein n=1 Tax=uncultured Methylobacterium sp. TaxID=157278 RepID=UPI0035CC451C